MIFLKNKSKGIAFFIPTFHPLPYGGAESQAFLLIKNLKNEGFNVFVITTGKRGLKKFEVIEKIDVYRLPTIFSSKSNTIKDNFKNSKSKVRLNLEECKGQTYLQQSITIKTFIAQLLLFIKLVFFYFKQRRSLNFQLIYLPTIFEFALPLAIFSFIFRKKLIIKDSTADGIIRMPNTVFPNFTRKFICNTSYFIAMTNTIKENFLKVGIPNNRISIIPNGIAIEELSYNKKEKNNECLFVGNLTQQPAKGIDVLLKAWSKVVKFKYSNAKLIIVGRGVSDEYYEFVNKMGIESNVLFTGSSNPRIYYENCSIFILPSRREGMSNALIEAMHYKLAVIATNISGNKDLIENGISGIIIPVDDEEVLADRIIYLLENPQIVSDMGEQARIRIIQKCDILKVSKLYMNAFNSLLE